MSAFCHIPSPNDIVIAKMKDAQQHTADDWMLVSEAKLDPMLSNDEHTAEEECKAQEAARWAKEEAMQQVREEAMQKAREAAEAQADTEQRALKERLWEVAGQWSEAAVAPPQVAKPSRRMASGVQDPCTRCCNNGICCILGTAKGKTTACEVCWCTKVSCSWTKRMINKKCKWKRVCNLEETEGKEVIKVNDEEVDNNCSHFTVLPHLVEDHWDALRALMTMLDTLSMDLCAFWQDSWEVSMEMLGVMGVIAHELRRANDLKEEEMGRSKAKEKAKEEEPRRSPTEDNNGDMEMGGVGPSLLV
ncbi:hypothetical protein ID866_10746 [Astraeus odoratus]|nr:hypothetical protein ID866_10746 [Astraeus odoratus]